MEQKPRVVTMQVDMNLFKRLQTLAFKRSTVTEERLSVSATITDIVQSHIDQYEKKLDKKMDA